MIYFARIDFGTFETRPSSEAMEKYRRHPACIRSLFFIKIGCSNNPAIRVKTLSGEYDRPVSLLAMMPGGLLEEEMMHNRFDHARLPRSKGAISPEWFFPTADLMKFVDWLIAHPPAQLDGKSGSKKIPQNLSAAS